MDVSPLTPKWLFAAGGAGQCSRVEWGQPVLERGPGVYVITVNGKPLNGQHVVYIGRAKSLSRRLSQFYRHKYGASSPQRGGQEILKLEGPKVVHWGRIETYAGAERLMMEAFYGAVGAWPHGNKVRSARMR